MLPVLPQSGTAGRQGSAAGFFVSAAEDRGEDFENSPDYADEPSFWAEEEVSAAIREGLVSEALQCDYQKPITRAEIAELLPECFRDAADIGDWAAVPVWRMAQGDGTARDDTAEETAR